MRMDLLKALNENFGIKVFAAFTGLIFVISLSFALFFISHQSEFLTDGLRKNGKLLAQVLAHNARIGVFSESKELLDAAAEGIFQQEGVLEVSIFNLDEVMLVSKERPGTRTSDKSIAGDGWSNHKIFEKVKESFSPIDREGSSRAEFWSLVISGSVFPGEESLLLEGHPLQKKGRLIGFVRVTTDKGVLNKRLNDLLFKSVLMVIIFLVISSGVVYIVVKGIIKPLNRLTEGVKTLGMEGVVEKVPVETRDEIGKLAIAFNNMSESLKNRESAFRQSEERYRELSDRIADVFFAMDHNLKFVYWNKASEELTGIAARDAVGKTLHEILPDTPENRREEGVYLDVLRQQRPQSFTNEYLLAGKRLIFEIIVYPSRTGLSVYAKNITERIQAEQELRRSRGQLRDLADHLQSVREEERTNIAREIHDELGQNLTGLKMGIVWLAKSIPTDQKPILEEMKAISALIDITIKIVQRISTELRPGLLDNLGLVAAMEWQAREFEKRAGITCRFSVSPEKIAVHDKLATALFRIFQESLTNVARHAEATSVAVHLKERSGILKLLVIDNGKGISKAKISDSKSFGLIGMRERVYPWGGEVKIKGFPDKGTTVLIRIPLKK
jgi:PAS domain S-box-containing protein